MFSKHEQTDLWHSMEELTNSNFALALTTYATLMWFFYTIANLDKKQGLPKMFFICTSWCLLGLGLQLSLKKLYESKNQKIALDFYTLNPVYPEMDSTQVIFCPILHGPSNQPICISYFYKNHAYVHVFDYPSLSLWFHSNTRCPANDIDLQHADVTQLRFSFDIPPHFLIEDEISDEEHSARVSL